MSLVSLLLATQLTLGIYGSGVLKRTLDLWNLHTTPAEALHWTVECGWDVIERYHRQKNLTYKEAKENPNSTLIITDQ